MSRLLGKRTMWFPTRSDTNRAVQSQKMVRGWKFWIQKVEESYYPCRENKGVISLAVTAKLICVFVFRLCRLFVFSYYCCSNVESEELDQPPVRLVDILRLPRRLRFQRNLSQFCFVEVILRFTVTVRQQFFCLLTCTCAQLINCMLHERC